MKRIAQIAALVFVVLAALYLFCPKPELKGFHTYSRAFVDRNGILLRITLAQDEQYRLYVPLEGVSPIFQEATLLYEDQYFYQHAGVDPIALCRAFWDTYVVRHRKIGASTITMQVARLRWNIKSGTVYGKIIQIVRALQLTRHYNKPEILEAYYNLAPYGRNIEGIEAASMIYFNKHAAALSLPEALTLSVIPQSPSQRNPTNQKGFAELIKARENLFHRWIENHKEDENKQV
ncbi:MAG: penicillin-binding protein 1C, partial [bacterium]|nr:penicillin-binding protein 1C [bacterium]